VLPMDWAKFVSHHALSPDGQRRYESVLGTATGPRSSNGQSGPLREQLLGALLGRRACDPAHRAAPGEGVPA
jgi:hypothetical protein